MFNTLLAEYIVACDQPFDTVEKPEFIRLMEYTHHGSTLNFNIPGRTAIKTRIMKMGEDTVAGTRQMFKVSYCTAFYEVTELIRLQGTRVESKHLSRCLDLSKPASLPRNCRAFCFQRGATRCVPKIAFITCFLFGLPEELLIDFRELVGEHSGENMAEEVWSTLETYGLDDGRVHITSDNALDDLPDLIPV